MPADEFTLEDFSPPKDEFSVDDFKPLTTPEVPPSSPMERAARDYYATPPSQRLTGERVKSPTEPFIPIPRAESNNPLVRAFLTGVLGQPPSDQTAANAAALYNTAKGFAEFSESPVGLLTAPIGGGVAGPLAQKALGLGFAAYIASQVPESARQAGTASVTGTPQEKAEAYLGLGSTIALPALLGAGVARKGEETVTPKVTEAKPEFTLEDFTEKPLSKDEKEFQLLHENWLPTIKPWRQELLKDEVKRGEGGPNIETNFQDSMGARDVTRAMRYYELARKLYGRTEGEEIKPTETTPNLPKEQAEPDEATSPQTPEVTPAIQTPEGTQTEQEKLHSSDLPVSTPKSFGENYVEKHGIAGAVKRVNYLENEISSGKRTPREMENLSDEASNIRKSIVSNPPTPQIQGMGGAVPSEFDQPGSNVSNMFAAIDRDRAEMGKPPMEPGVKRTWDEDNQKALAQMNRDPGWVPNLISEVLKKPRPLLSWENAGLVWQRQAWTAEYNNALKRIAQSFDDGRTDALGEAKLDAARFEDNLERLDRAVGRGGTGSEAGRTLQAQKMGAGDDFTLIEMRLRKRGANGGKPLTPEQDAEVKSLHEQLQKANEEYKTHLAQRDAEAANLRNQLAVAEIKRQAEKQPFISPAILKAAEKIVSALDSKADAARERIKARGFRFSAGLDPTVLLDVAEIGASHIAHIGLDLAKWSAKMVEEFGEAVRPHLNEIFAASQKLIDSIGAKEPVKRQVKGQTLDEFKQGTVAAVKEKAATNDRPAIGYYAQRLARMFVQSGINDREPLIDAVHSVLNEAMPELTRRETMDAISGYGDFKQLSKDEISVQVRGMKGEMQQLAKLEDMTAGTPPLKTGMERRTPTEAESRLIKQVNEAKKKFQIPSTDPSTQLQSALDTVKKTLTNRIKDYEERIAKQDYSKRKTTPIVLDDTAMRLKARVQRLKNEFDEGVMKDRSAKRSTREKVADFTGRWRREWIFTSLTSLVKLPMAALEGMIAEPAQEVVAKGVGAVFPRFSERTEIQRPSSLAIEVRAINETRKKILDDIAKNYKTGQSDIDTVLGKHAIPPELRAFMGKIHAILKSPLKRSGFERTAAKLTEQYAERGIDVSNPLVEMEIQTKTATEANRLLFQEDNALVDAYQRFLSRFTQPDPATGKPTILNTAARIGLGITLPVVRIPTNLVARTFQAASGFPVGATRLAMAYAKGIENLPKEQADSIMRQIKAGSLGGAIMLYGFFNPEIIGGYYQPGEKRKPGDVGTGKIRIGDYDVPSYLLHHPLLEVAQLGATIRRVADSKLKKSDREVQGLAAGIKSGVIGLIEETPFARDTIDIGKLRDPKTRDNFINQYLADLLIPQIVSRTAKMMDDKKRKPHTLGESVEANIPYLREEVPTK